METFFTQWMAFRFPTKEIRENLKCQEEGWGRLKVVAKIGISEWQTTIWFDTKANTYFLPLKAEIRKKEQLEIGKTVDVLIGFEKAINLFYFN